MKAKHYTKNEVLNSTRIGLEFEFFTKVEQSLIRKELGSVLGKKIITPLSIDSIGKRPKPVYHSKVSPTKNVFKLEPDYSGGSEMYEMITGALDYKEARSVIIKVYNWIKEKGYTNERCSVHVNISFDGNKLNTINKIVEMNVLKFILSFNEKFVYDRFPERKFNVYARSIKNIFPNSFFFYKNIPNTSIIENNFSLPNEKYYGINFLKKVDNYLEFRYMGGKNYETKLSETFETIDHFILSLYDSINKKDYTENELDKINVILKEHKVLVESMANYNLFQKNFPDFKIMIDLKTDEQVVLTFWEKIKPIIFKLIRESKIEKCEFNYDTETGKYQIAYANINDAKISGFDVVNSKINGIITNCNLYYCQIKDSRISKSNIYRGNTIKNSKIEFTELFADNDIIQSLIHCPDVTINSNLKNCIVRHGNMGGIGEYDDKTIFVNDTEDKLDKDYKKAQSKKDWRWIKKMSEDYDKE